MECPAKRARREVERDEGRELEVGGALPLRLEAEDS